MSVRNRYWNCLDKYAPEYLEMSGEQVPTECAKLQKMFHVACPDRWVMFYKLMHDRGMLPSFLDREKIQKCLEARNTYWTDVHANRSPNLVTIDSRKEFEAACPAQWVKYYDHERAFHKEIPRL